MPIFHVATLADWEEAQASGRYTTSTRGRSLAEEGFVHAAHADQWQAVRERYYTGVTEPLVLLVIDPARLGAPVVDEAVPGTAETFPHVYGVIEVDAVTRAIPLDPAPDGTTASPAPMSPAAPNPPPAAGPTAPPRPARPARPGHRSFMSLFLEEMAVHAAVGLAVIVVAATGGLVVVATAGDLAGLITMVALLVLGGLVAAWLLRRLAARRTGGVPGPAGSGRADSEE